MARTTTLNNTAATVGFEQKLWAAADALRNNMDAAEYKHVVLGLIFLKYISDAFEAKHAELAAQKAEGADPEDPDEYRAASIFWVPKEARWSHLKASAPQPTIGTLIVDAMAAIERENEVSVQANVSAANVKARSAGRSHNPSLKGVLPKDYRGRASTSSASGRSSISSPTSRSATAPPGRRTRSAVSTSTSSPSSRAPRARRAGSSTRPRTWCACWSRCSCPPRNPPFNDSDWRGELLRDDKRWVYGMAPAGNANFAWVQHFLHHLAPSGIAGFVLANGSMSSNQSGEGEIRKAIIEADLVDCMVALPGQLFYSTQIPVCLWFLARDKKASALPAAPGAKRGAGRDRRGHTLFIDARKLGTMVDRVHRELTTEDIARIAGTYHLWRGDPHPCPLPKGAGEKQYRGGFDFSGLAQTARDLRKKQTPAEAVMWELLRDRRFMNLKFRRQHQVGEYVADFYCDEHKLVIELDGSIHGESGRAKKDRKRDAYMAALGLTVLRIENADLLADPESSLHQIAGKLPSPLGRGAGGEGNPAMAAYADIPGFCKSASLEEIRKHGHVLTPGRYVGAEAQDDDGEPFEEKMKRLTATLREQQAEAAKLDAAIAANLKELGYGG